MKKAEKKKNQTREIGGWVIKLIIIIGAIPFFIAPFIHIVMPKKSKEVIEFVNHLNDIERQQAASLEKLKKNSLANGLSLQNYFLEESKLLDSFKIINAKNENEIRKLRESQTVFGFRTMRIFFIGFGTRIVILFLAIILLFSFYIRDEELKKIVIYISYSFIGVGLYLNIWFIWDGSDFPQSFYYLAIGLMTIIGLITTYLLVTRYESISSKLKGAINQLIVFIINSDKYIDSKEKENKHFLDSMDVFEKIVK